MSVITWKDYLENFFAEEKILLNENYPGINLKRLISDFKLFYSLNENTAEDVLEKLYLPSKNSSLVKFFQSLKDGIPLEYITGISYFYKSTFKVSPSVLIPRNETEILVELAINEIKKINSNNIKVLDLCTGSGAIALSVLMEENVNVEVLASDISEDALKIAKENYFNLKFSIPQNNVISFVKSDKFENIDGKFDIILSNPPYIKKMSDRKNVHAQVLKYEPQLALFIEDEKYHSWFMDFFKGIYHHLNHGGISIVEGHEDHLVDLKSLAKSMGFTSVELVDDYTNRNRFLKLYK